ncbi:MAG: hypothetical protein ACI9VR_002388 [Cognaticolwellia sp.]
MWRFPHPEADSRKAVSSQVSEDAVRSEARRCSFCRLLLPVPLLCIGPAARTSGRGFGGAAPIGRLAPVRLSLRRRARTQSAARPRRFSICWLLAASKWSHRSGGAAPQRATESRKAASSQVSEDAVRSEARRCSFCRLLEADKRTHLNRRGRKWPSASQACPSRSTRLPLAALAPQSGSSEWSPWSRS